MGPFLSEFSCLYLFCRELFLKLSKMWQTNFFFFSLFTKYNTSKTICTQCTDTILMFTFFNNVLLMDSSPWNKFKFIFHLNCSKNTFCGFELQCGFSKHLCWNVEACENTFTNYTSIMWNKFVCTCSVGDVQLYENHWIFGRRSKLRITTSAMCILHCYSNIFFGFQM